MAKSTNRQDQRETGSDHESTWGATEAAKAEWQDKRGDAKRREVEKANEQAAKAE